MILGPHKVRFSARRPRGHPLHVGPGDFFGALRSTTPAPPRRSGEDATCSRFNAATSRVVTSRASISAALIKVLCAPAQGQSRRFELALLDVYGASRGCARHARDEGRRLRDGRIAFRVHAQR